jgi:hypothetical protein
MRLIAALLISTIAASTVTYSQETPAQQKQETPVQQKQSLMSPTARLQAAKTMYVKDVRGNGIAHTVITSGLEGWGKYKMVDSVKDADLVVEITAPQESSGMSISSSTSPGEYGKPESSTKTTKELSGGSLVTMTVYDTRNNVPLWRGSEKAKSAMKQKARQDNLVEAAQKVLANFRDRVEPVK